MRLKREYRAQIRADFRQYYGLSFDRAVEESVVEAADLLFMLPRGSRTFSAIDPEFSWEQEHYLLASIANSLQILVWAQSKDGQKNRNRPKPIMPPKKQVEKSVSCTADEYKEKLSRPRKGV